MKIGDVNSSLITMTSNVAISGLEGSKSNYTPMLYNNFVETMPTYLVFMHLKQHKMLKNIIILKKFPILSEGIIRI